jgi:hypothetical protein
MLLTEEQAREKYCPFWASGDWTIKCEASKCMMWRWGEFSKSDKPRGYCGLAGRPQFYYEGGEDGK